MNENRLKLDWQWPPAFVFCVLTICMTFLVYKGMLHPHVFAALPALLAPGPWQQAKPALPPKSE